MPRIRLITKSVTRENYFTPEKLGADFFRDAVSDILKKTSLRQIRSGLATAIEPEAGATRIISEDDLGHDL
jgi:hypothetical protein